MSERAIGLLEWFRPGEEERVEALLAEARALGVSHVRTGLSWADWHREGGEAWFEWLVPRLAAEVDLLPCLHYTPPSLGVAPRSSAPPRVLKDYADFVDVVITRFGDHFTHVEIWNEPNNATEWDLRLDPGWRRFASMAAGAAHWARRRGKRVVLGGMSPIDPGWLDLMFRLGLMRHVDVVGVHGFPGVWDARWDGWEAHLGEVRDVLDRHGSDAEVWITETGYSTWRLDEREQLRRFLEAAEAPARRVYWYGLDDLPRHLPSHTGFHVDEREYHCGLRGGDGRGKLLHRLWRERGAAGLRRSEWLAGSSGPLPRDDFVAITGGAGFVGVNVAHRLLSRGRAVLLLDDLSRPTSLRNLEWLRERHGDRVRIEVADVRDEKAVSRVVSRASYVLHLAAQVAVTTSLGEPARDFEVNARGTLNVLEALRASADPPPLVFTSTNKVYGPMPDVALRANGSRYRPEDGEIAAHGVSEARALDFRSPYGCSKGAADQYVLDYARTFGLPAAVLRMSCVYGPHQFGTEDQGWVAHFLIQAMRGRPLVVYGDGRQVRDLLFVEDLVEAILAAERRFDRVAGRAFNVGGGPRNTLSLLELLAHLRDRIGAEPSVAFEDWRPGDQPWYVSDTRAFEEATAWRPAVGVPGGLDRLGAWARDVVLPALGDDDGAARARAREPAKT